MFIGEGVSYCISYSVVRYLNDKKNFNGLITSVWQRELIFLLSTIYHSPDISDFLGSADAAINIHLSVLNDRKLWKI